MFLGEPPWIRFDADLGVGRDIEPLPEVASKVRDLLGGQERRCAPAPVDLRHRAVRREVRRQQVNLALQVAEVFRDPRRIVGHLHVAAAVVAELPAEGEVEIQRQRRVGSAFIHPAHLLPKDVAPRLFVKVRRRRIARVPGQRAVVLANEVEVDVHRTGRPDGGK